MYVYRHYHPPYCPHVFKPAGTQTEEQRVEVRLWCIEQFGAPGIHDGGGRYAYSDKTQAIHGLGAVAFRDETDAFAFRMRWC